MCKGSKKIMQKNGTPKIIIPELAIFALHLTTISGNNAKLNHNTLFDLRIAISVFHKLQIALKPNGKWKMSQNMQYLYWLYALLIDYPHIDL